jgi:hypothetical protein
MGPLGEATAKLVTTVQSLDEVTVHQLPGEGEWSDRDGDAGPRGRAGALLAHRARQVAEGTLGARPYDRSPHEYALRNAAVADHGGDSLPGMVGWLRSSAIEAAEVLRAIPDNPIKRWDRSALYASHQVRQTGERDSRPADSQPCASAAVEGA